LDVLLGGVVDVKLGSRGHVDGLGTGLADQLVEQADVGKRAARHDLVVASASAVRVEVTAIDTANEQTNERTNERTNES